MTSFVRNSVLGVALLFSTAAIAAPVQLQVLVDADRDAATGCASGGFAGAERVVTATVDAGAAGATVSGVAIQTCAGGLLGTPAPVTGGAGAATFATSSGQMLVEIGVPWSALDLGATPSSIRLGYLAQIGTATDNLFTSGSGGMIVYPVPTGRRRVVGVNDFTINVDGTGADWGGIAPLAAGSAAGGPGAIRLQNVFAHANATTLWFRMDAKVSADAPVAVDDAYTVRQGKAVTIPSPGVLTNDSDPNGKPLSAAIATPPNHGTVNLAGDGGFTYVHDGTTEPGDSFEYKASNGTQESNRARVNLSVTPNGAPDANNDNYSVAHRGTLTVPQPGVLANDSDPDGDTMRAVLASAPKFGTLTLAQNGSFTYTHNGSNTLADSFTYRASDGTSQSSSARVNITIGADQPPAGVADAYTVAEGATLNVTAPGVLGNDTDPDTPANLLVATVVSNPAHGALTLGANGNLTYVHDGSETTSDAFTYTVGDGILTSAPVTVAITVTPVNDAPVATNDAYATNEDTPLTIPAAGVLANDSDAENNALSAALVANAAHGSVALGANGGFTYTPNANYNGTDSFTYTANDAGGPSNVATVTITVAAVNDAPSFAAGANVSVNEDAGAYSSPWATAISAGAADEAGQTLTFNVTNGNNALFAVQPSIAPNGTLSFTPAVNANGTATVTVTLVDNGSAVAPSVNASAAQTFSITVNAVNDAPSFMAGGNVTVGEDSGLYSAAHATGMIAGPPDETSQTLAFNTSNDDNALFTVQPSIAPSGVLTFTPAPNASGVATVTVTLSDDGGTANGGVDTSAAQTFTITISGVNDAPVITRPASASVDEDTALAFTGGNAISVADVDAAAGSVTLTLGVSNGTLNFGASAGLTVSGDGTGAVTASGPLVSLNVALSTLTYTPSAEYAGSDTLTIGVNDNGNSGSGGPLTDSQAVALTVNAVNDAPALSLPPAQTTDEDTPLVFSSGNGNAITIADIDAGSGDVTVTLSTTDGTITIGNTAGLTSASGDGSGNVSISGTVGAINTALEGTVFSPTADFNGSATLDVVVDDGGNTGLGGALQANGTIAVTINAVNDGPSLTAPSLISGSEDVAITLSGTNAVSVSDVDAGTGALTLTLTSNNGSVTLASTTGLTVSGDGTALVTATGSLADLNAALNGATFTPAPNFSGAAGLDINIDDNGNTGAPGGSTSDSRSIFILLLPVNDPPVAVADSYSTNEDTPLSVTAPGVLTNDSDVEGNSLTAVLVSGPSSASSFTLNADGSFNYTPNANFSGSDSFTYKANDALADSNVVTVTITVSAVNDAPVVSRPATVTTAEDTPFTFSGTISVADIDGGSGSETLTLTTPSGTLALSGTAGLTVSGNGTSSVTASGTLANLNAALNGLVYTPVAEFAGGVSLSITINDGGSTGSGGAQSDSKSTSITINAVNDAPVNSVPGAQTVNEDATLTLSSGNGNAITISDVDAGSADVTVTLSSANGTLTLGGTAGLTTVTGNGTGSVVLTGPISAINTALNGTVFTVAVNFAGATSIAVATNDNGNSGSGGAKAANSSITVNVTAVNDAPSITRPAAVATNEDTPLTFNGGNVISIADVDAASGSITVTLGVANGMLTLGGTTNLTVSGNGTNAISASGALTDINNALNGLVYAPALNYNGADTLTIGVNDNGNTGTGGALSDSKSVALTVNAINDAPVAVADAYSTNEDTPLAISAPGVKANDSDVDSGSFSAVLVSGPSSASSFTLNADGSFSYTPNANFSGTDAFSYKDNDGGLDSNTVVVTITVNAVNDGPVNAMPSSPTMPRDTTLTMTGAGAIQISDVDAGTNPLQVTLTGGNATMTLSGTAGLSFTSGDGTTDASMVFTGTISAINAALNGLQFTPTPGYSGSATLQIVTDDQGFTGLGGPLSDSDTLSVTVLNVNQAPVNTVPGAQGTNEDTPLVFSSGNGNAISISDADAGGASVKVTLGVTQGTLTLGGITGLSFTTGDGTADPSMVFTGTISAINTAFATVTYTPNANYSGTDTLTITTDDQGNTGPGGAKTDSDSVTINIAALNDAPVAVDDSAYTVFKYTATTNTSLNVSAASGVLANDTDVDTPAASLTAVLVTGPAHSQSFTLNGNGSFTYVPATGYTGTDTFTYKANDGALDSNVATATITIQNHAPLPGTDSFTGVGNTSLEVGVTTFTTPRVHLIGNLLTNDTDADGDTLTLTSGTVASVNGGSATINADGTFTYSPAPNVTSDSFTYTVSDGSASNATANGTVNLTLSNKVWYVKNDFVGTSNGTSAQPFKTLANAISGSAAGSTIFIMRGDGSSTGLTGSFQMRASDTWLGEGVALIVGANTLWPAGSAPVITNAAADTILLAQNVTLKGVTVSTTGADSVKANNIALGTSTIDTVTFNGNGGLYVLGGSGTLNVQNSSVSTSGTGTGFQWINGTATTNFIATPINHTTGGSVIYVQTPSGGGATFDAASPISGGNSSGTNAIGIVSLGNAVGNAAVTVNSTVTLTMTGGGSGISISGTTGASTVTFAGNVTVNANGSGSGISVANNPGGTITFSAAKDVNGTTGFGAFVDNNAGSTVNFSNGSFTIDTTTGTGLYLVGGGAITIGGSGNTINSTGGTALDARNGAHIVTFDSLTSGGSGANAYNVQFDGETGTLNLGNGALSGATNYAVHALNLTAASSITYNGTITTAGTAQPLFAHNNSGGSLTLGGNVTTTGGGIVVQTSTGGTVTLSGAQSLAPTAAGSTALAFVSSTGATLTVSGSITATVTGSLNGITASGGGTINLTNANNVVTAATGTAVQIVNSTIGAPGVTFKSVSANGGANGVVLTNAGSGPFSITGTGSAGTGGTIQGETTAAIAISSMATGNVSLANLTLSPSNALGISGSTFGTLTIGANVSVAGTSALNLATGTVSGTFASVSSSGGTNGVNLNAVSGTWGTTAGALTGASGATFNVSGSAAAGSAITWGGTITQNNAATAVTISGHNRNITFTGNVASGGTSTGVSISGSSGAYAFNGTNAFTGAGGIVIGANESGSVSFSTNTTNTVTGTAFQVAGTAVNPVTAVITYSGTINKTSGGRMIDVASLNSTGSLTMTHAPAATGNLSVNHNASTGISIVNSSATITIANASLTFNNSAAGVTASGNSGTINLNGLAIAGGGNKAGLLISGGGTINIGAGAANSTVNMTGGTGSAIDGTTASFTGTLGLSNVTITGNTAAAVTLTGSTLGGAGSSVTGGGPALVLSGVALANGGSFASVSSSGGATGISLTTVTGGPFTISGGSLVGNTTGFFADGGSPSVTYAGSIKSTGFVVDIGSTTAVGGAQTFSGAIGGTAAADGGTGIRVQRASGTVTFSGTQTFGSTATRQPASAVTLANNTGTITFSGTLTAATSNSGTAFSATGGGTVVVTGSANTLDASSGTALDITNATIGASGVKVLSISAGNNTASADPANGIVLNNTGTIGSLTVSGSGSAASGGTIQNVSNVGILLTSTTSPSFNNMVITGTTSHGISGILVNNFTFTNGTVTNSGSVEIAGRQESNINFFQYGGITTQKNLTGNVTITGNTLNYALHHGINITQYDGTINSLNISNNTFQSATASSGSSNGATTSHGTAILVNPIGSTTTIASLGSVTISNNQIVGFPGNAGVFISGGNANPAPAPQGSYGTAALPIVIQSNRIHGFSSANKMNTQAIAIAINGTSPGFVNILDNGTVAEPLGDIAGAGINVSALGESTVTVTVSNNRLVANNTVSSQGIALGADISAGFAGAPTMNATVTNNNVSATSGNGIQVLGTRNAVVNAKVQNNTVGTPLSGTYGISLVAATSSTGTATGCFAVSGNTTSGGTNAGTTWPGIGLRRQNGAFSNGPNIFGIVGLPVVAPATSAGSPAVENYVNSNNTSASGTFGTGGTALYSATTGFTPCTLSF